jgi:vitellogenic carboxypeptidase-like protein
LCAFEAMGRNYVLLWLCCAVAKSGAAAVASDLAVEPILSGFDLTAEPILSGFVTVNETARAKLFYWYTPSKTANASVAVWLNGGPGSSSFIGAFAGLGPFELTADLVLKPRMSGAWSDNMHLIVVDNPVGVGWSYTESGEGYVDTQEQMAANFVAFLKGFYTEHPLLMSQPLFLTGESYAGKYIPCIASAILDDNELRADGATSRINLAGVAIGNGLTDPILMAETMSASYYSLGLIDQNQRNQGEALQNDCVQKAKAGDWAAATKARNKFQEYLSNATGGANNEDVRLYHPYNWTFIEAFMNLNSTRNDLLHIPATAPPFCVHGCPHVHAHLNDDIMKPYAHLIPKLLQAGLRVLLYQGHMDLRDGVAATEAWLHNRSLAVDWPPLLDFLTAERRVGQRLFV